MVRVIVHIWPYVTTESNHFYYVQVIWTSIFDKRASNFDEKLE